MSKENMYANPKERAESFMACREIGLSIQDPKLRRQFQAMIKDTDKLMNVFTQDEMKEASTSFNVAEKTIWTLGELGQSLLKRADGSPRTTKEVKELLHTLEFLICEDGKTCEAGKRLVIEKHVVGETLAPVHPRFTSLFYIELKNYLETCKEEAAAKAKERTRKENEANGIYEEPESKK